MLATPLTFLSCFYKWNTKFTVGAAEMDGFCVVVAVLPTEGGPTPSPSPELREAGSVSIPTWRWRLRSPGTAMSLKV